MKIMDKVPDLKLSKKIVKISSCAVFVLLIILIVLFSLNMDRLYRDSIFENVYNTAVLLSSSDIYESSDIKSVLSECDDISSVYTAERINLNFRDEYRYSYSYILSDSSGNTDKSYTEKCIDVVYQTFSPCTSENYVSSFDKNSSAVGASPVFDENGKIKYVVCVEAPLRYGFPYVKTSQAVIYGIIFAVMSLCIVFVFKFSDIKVIQPFEKIGKYAKTLMVPETYGAITEYNQENAIDIIVRAVEAMREKQERLDESLEYAKAIQSRLLTPVSECQKYFTDFDVWWYPLAVVSGDFYKVRKYDKGKLVVIGDCTGHGIPGALMTMMVSTIIENSIVSQFCDDTRNILWTLDRQLSQILNSQRSENEVYITHGLDIIVMFIDNKNNIQISSAGMHFFIVGNEQVDIIRGQRLFIGDGKIENKRKIKVTSVKGNPECSYYVATDGLFEQLGGEKQLPFGYSKFKKAVLKHNDSTISSAIEAVKDEYFGYKGSFLRLDDVTVIGFKL